MESPYLFTANLKGENIVRVEVPIDRLNSWGSGERVDVYLTIEKFFELLYQFGNLPTDISQLEKKKRPAIIKKGSALSFNPIPICVPQDRQY